MKRTVFIFIALLSCLGGQAEQSYTLSNPLNGGQDHHYVANSHITLDNGFFAEPQNGHEVALEIDALGVFPPENGITGGTTSNNTNGVVGSLGGTVDVSQLGGAVYAIPIDLPEGLGGMRPQLSICYNSQGRNSLLGWAWNLEGLSAITRTNSTPYHDGSIGINNRFCLDGKRLMKTGTGAYGTNGVSYRTEEDQMSRIISYQESGHSGPSYFKVWTADGKILHYGHSTDSKAFIDQANRVNLWLLNKVEDRDGNVMEYRYTIESDSYRLDEILYSSNPGDNIGYAFRVVFNYNSRSDVELSYMGNCVHRKKHLLQAIEVYNGNAKMYSYTFTYQSPQPHAGYYCHLLTSIRLDAGDEHLNPTRILWGSNNYSALSGSQLKYSVTTNGVPNAFVNAVKFSGDFNGDGYDDIVAVQPNGNGQYTQAQVFVNRGATDHLTFDYVRSFNLSSNISWIQVADVNGDGYDDILFSNRIRGVLLIPDHIETVIYLSRMTPNGSFEFIRKSVDICSVPHDMVETHLVGDFFGEGMNSILIQSVSNSKTGPETSLLYRYDESTGEFQTIQIPEHLQASRFFPADFNGDGITEILYKKENGRTAMAQLTRNGNSYHYTELYSGNPCDWDDCFPGDYNGDGLIDLLFYTANANQKWSIHLACPNGIGSISYPLPQSFPYSSPGNYQFSLDRPNHTSQYIKVGDFDGNGCADLALYKDNLFHVFYGPLRTDGNAAPFANTQQISIQAFNLYDNMGVCLGNFLGQERFSFLGPATLSRLPSASLRLEVKQITDGMGRNTDFTYDYLVPNPGTPSDDDFYHVNSFHTSHSRHVHSIPLPLRALKTLTTYNVSNQPVTTCCFYEGALIHNQGKGFLGFSTTRQDDYCRGQLQKKTLRQYGIDYSYDLLHMSLMEESVFDRNGTLMAKSTFSNWIYTHLQNGKVYIPITNKTIEAYDVHHPNRMLKKEIYETTVATHCAQSERYNDVLSVSCQHKGTTSHPNLNAAGSCEFQEIFMTDYLPDDLGTWLINRPETTTSIARRQGSYADLCHHKAFTYDSSHPHRIQSVLDIPNDGSHPEDPLTLQTDYQYDPTGNVISQILTTPNDQQTPRCESFEYSKAYGRRLLTKHRDALNQESCYTYHPIYNYCASSTDCNGITTEYEQDPFGTTVYTHHPDGTVSCRALRWSGGVYYLWEKQTGRETKMVHYAPTGDITRVSRFDINGNLLLSRIEYDGYGKVVKKSVPCQLDETPRFVNYEYDPHNQVCHIYHSDGVHESIEHDGDEVRTRYYALDGSFQEQSKTFNIMGWLVKSTDAEGNSVIYDYRADGKPTGSQIEGFEETRITMEYDALGNLTLLADPDYGTVSYEHNAFNELIHQVSPNRNDIVFHYDALGRITSRIETDGNTHLQEVTEWTYGTTQGQRGLLTQISTPNQTIHYTYDPLLRLTGLSENIMGTAYQTSYTYDKASRVVGTTYPSGYQVNYHYTSEGLLKRVTDEQLHNLWTTVETNALQQPTRFRTGDGSISTYGYDGNSGRLVSIQTTNGTEPIQNIAYEYDDYSNMTTRNDLNGNRLEHFGYDPLNRLTSIETSEGSSEFQYDPLGRMVRKSSPEGLLFDEADYTGPKPHALKSVQAPHGVFPQERMDIAFNVFDKVESIDEGNTHIHFDYGYDHQRIRMDESINGAVRSKTYVNCCEFITMPNGSQVTRTFIPGPTGVFAVAETANGHTQLHYIHKDHLGSWVVISDSEGHVEQENHFDAWGNCPHADSLRFDRGFTGHEHIHGTGLVNMNGRLYDPLTSSMLSPDNHIQTPDFTQNFNRYAYCLNNPLSYTDPDGNTALEAVLAFYILYCTDLGYEFQKYTLPLAIHLDLHLSSQQIGIGADFSLGIPKQFGISYRAHCGATYYWRFYDDSYSGFEFRVGAEWCVGGCIGYSGTTFVQGRARQTTNAIIIGNYWCNFTYENDYMFHLENYIHSVPAADNGDRYRSAAARFRFAVVSVGVNLFTGDPGVDHAVRRTFNDPDAGGRETYTISANGDDPNQYRAGVFYVGLGPFKIGSNSEQVRNTFQNRFAHDFLCKKDSPYFKVLDRPGQTYFYFGTETGSTLW